MEPIYLMTCGEDINGRRQRELYYTGPTECKYTSLFCICNKTKKRNKIYLTIYKKFGERGYLLPTAIGPRAAAAAVMGKSADV